MTGKENSRMGRKTKSAGTSSMTRGGKTSGGEKISVKEGKKRREQE